MTSRRRRIDIRLRLPRLRDLVARGFGLLVGGHSVLLNYESKLPALLLRRFDQLRIAGYDPFGQIFWPLAEPRRSYPHFEILDPVIGANPVLVVNVLPRF